MSNQSANKASRPAASEKERLARDVFLKLIETPGFTGKTGTHLAEIAFQKAAEFLEVASANK